MLTELVNPSEDLSTIALISSPSLLLPLEALVPILMHLLVVVFILCLRSTSILVNGRGVKPMVDDMLNGVMKLETCFVKGRGVKQMLGGIPNEDNPSIEVLRSAIGVVPIGVKPMAVILPPPP
jgi:hypothetical protein